MLKLKVVEQKEKITNDWTVEKVATEYPPFTWEAVFESAKHEIKDVSDILEEDKRDNGERIPNNCDLFRAFHLTPLHNIRVVILAMDPYGTRLPDGRPLATGLAFSVPKDAPIPSSLRNIYKELKESIPEFVVPNHGDLIKWSLQGVFLLNSSLTVRNNESGSHGEVWSGFIKKVIHAILESNPKCIFVAWGNNAQKVANKFVGEKAVILTSAHPSGYSANRGFFGCKHFSRINELLIAQKSRPINWNL